jgi:hypothetical protein
MTVRAWFRVWRTAEYKRRLTLSAEDTWREDYSVHPAYQAFERRVCDERAHDEHWAWLIRRQAQDTKTVHKPSKDEVWVYIDSISEPQVPDKIWEVQDHKQTYRAEAVIIQTESTTKFFGSKHPEPRAVILVTNARVIVAGNVAVIGERR